MASSNGRGCSRNPSRTCLSRTSKCRSPDRARAPLSEYGGPWSTRQSCIRRRSTCRPSLCRLMRCSRIASSASDTCRIAPYPASGSMPLTTSIIALERGFPQRREEPRVTEHGFFHQRVAGAHGHAVAARDAARFLNRRASVPEHSRVRIFPVDRQRFVHFDVLTRFDAPAAENALVGVVAIEGIAVIDFVGFGRERDSLMLDREQLRRVVHGAIPVVVVAHRAIEEMVAENAIERLCLRSPRARGRRAHDHAVDGVVAHARTSWPSTSIMQVSHVWMAPSCG